MLNTAIVGLGWWGKNLVKAARDFGAPLAFRARRHARARHGERFRRRAQNRHRHVVRGGAGRPAVKAVILATPHTKHRAQVEAAAAAGKHIYCEKPFALSKADAVAMLEAVQARRRRHRRRPSFPADAVDARAGRAEGGRRLRHHHACRRQLQPRLAGQHAGRQLAHGGGGKPRRRHDRHGHPRARLFPRSGRADEAHQRAVEGARA